MPPHFSRRTGGERTNEMTSAVASGLDGQDQLDSVSGVSDAITFPKPAKRIQAGLGQLSFDRLFPARGPMFERRDHDLNLVLYGVGSSHRNRAPLCMRS